MTITITVASRLATVEATEKVVAGNTYPVAVALDGEWTGTLYMRVRFGALYYDIPFQSTASAVSVQIPVGYPEVGIGIFSEALEICTNEARIRLLRSILEEGVEVVEFDNDLYNQWAEEVTELLCDDQFDVTSNRPVQNRILTAWKETVPLDADLVHKAGAETISGAKTFTSAITISTTGMQTSRFKTSQAHTTSFRRTVWEFYDKKDGADSMIASDTVTGLYGNGYNARILAIANLDRSTTYGVDIRAYADHCTLLVTPYYPVDSGGNPTPLTERALVASGNIAIDPRIVHTTGNESIAGVKTFTGSIALNGVVSCFRVSKTLPAGKWCKYYTFSRDSAIRRVVFKIRNTYMLANIDDNLYLNLAQRNNSSDAGTTNSANPVKICAKGNTVEVWVGGKTTSSSQIVMDFVYANGNLLPTANTDSVVQDNPPVEGEDGYTSVKNVEGAS